MGSIPQGILGVILNSGAMRSAIQNPLHGDNLIYSVPGNPFNYAIPARMWISRVVGTLSVFLHLTGLVRIRSLIALPKIQPE